jgi:hypothetical protein
MVGGTQSVASSSSTEKVAPAQRRPSIAGVT